jgi:hypothetical protein
MNLPPGSVALVTLTIGGNDLLQTYGNDNAAHTTRRALWEHGHALLNDLRDSGLLAPGAPILIGTIYDPSDGTGNTAALNLCPGPTPSTGSLNTTKRYAHWPASTAHWWPTSTPTSSATVFKPATRPSTSPSRPTAIYGFAAPSNRTRGARARFAKSGGTRCTRQAFGGNRRPRRNRVRTHDKNPPRSE